MTRPTCIRGHNEWATWRNERRCRACHRARNADLRARRRRGEAGPWITYDPAPLLAHLDRRWDTNSEIARQVGVTRRTVQRWRRGARVTDPVADRVCIALGLHVALVWGRGDAA